MLDTSYSYLINCSVHVGHSLSNSHRFCGWMVLAQRQEILLIDLTKFLYMFSKGVVFLQAAVRMRHPLWFVTLDPMKASIVRQSSKFCGEYHVSSGWIGGLITNFLLVSATSWVRTMYLSPVVHSAKQRLRRNTYQDWLLTRFTWPRVVFLCGVQRSYRVAREALRARIPCIGIADTATGAQALSLAVPGNDESLEAILFYNSLVTHTVLERKFTSLFGWANSVRKVSRLSSFVQWFFHYSSHLGRRAFPSAERSIPFAWSSSSFSRHPSFSSTASLLTAFWRQRLSSHRQLATEITSFFDDEEVFSLSHRQVRDFFRKHEVLFNSLTGLRFLASQRELLKHWMVPPFRSLRLLRPVHYSHRKATFTFLHNFFDLLGPSGMYRDYVYKRAVDLPPFLDFENIPLGRVVFSVLSALFLLASNYQRFQLQTPGSGLNPKSYDWRTPYRRRLNREASRPPSFFGEFLYYFLARLLKLTSILSSSSRLLSLPSRVLARVPRRKMKLLRLCKLKHLRHRVRSRPLPKRVVRALYSPRPKIAFRCLSLWYHVKHGRRKKRLSLRKAAKALRLASKTKKIRVPWLSLVSTQPYAYFAIDSWRLGDALLPKSYWQFRLLHTASESGLSMTFENTLGQRNYQLYLSKSYPLIDHSLSWVRRGLGLWNLVLAPQLLHVRDPEDSDATDPTLAPYLTPFEARMGLTNPNLPKREGKSPYGETKDSRDKRDYAPRDRRDSRHRKDYSPRDKRDYAPRHRKDYAPRDRRDYAPNDRKNYASRHRKDYAPNDRRDSAPRDRGDSRDRKNYAPNERKDYAPNDRRDSAPRDRGDSRDRKNYAPNERKDYAPNERKDYAPNDRRDSAPRDRGDSRDRKDYAPNDRRDSRDRKNYAPNDRRDSRDRKNYAPNDRKDYSSRFPSQEVRGHPKDSDTP